MTFSIVARCAETGMFGVGITSSSIAVGARCPQVRHGIGAVSSQNVTNPKLGTAVLDAIAAGESAHDAIAIGVRAEAFPDYRQVLAIDGEGRTAIYSGAKALGVTSEAQGRDCVAAGNMLADATLAAAIITAFEGSVGKHLAERLLLALEAGLALGGEAGPLHSAAIKVHADQPFPLVDLRVDWADDAPIAKVRADWTLYQPQMAAYAQRAVNPVDAPSYGVPGDL